MKEELIDSCAVYAFKRIERDIVYYDQRNKYKTDVAAYERTLLDRKRNNFHENEPVYKEDINDVSADDASVE